MFVFRNSFDLDSSEINGKLICQIESKTEFEHHWKKYAVKYIDGRDNLKEKSKEELKKQLSNWTGDKSLKLKYKDSFNFQIKKNGDIIEMKLKDCNMVVTFGIYQLKEKESPKKVKKEQIEFLKEKTKKEESPKEIKKEIKKEESPKEIKKVPKESPKKDKKENPKNVKFDNSKVIYSNGISEFRFEGSKTSMKELIREIDGVKKDIKKENEKENVYKHVSPRFEPERVATEDQIIDYSERTKNIKDERLKKRIKEILGNVE